MIEDLIDFIEIHPIVAFEATYESTLTSFWSLIPSAVQLYIIMQYKGQHPPLLPKMSFCVLYLPPKLVCIHQNFLHRVYTTWIQVFLDPSFLEWRLGCQTCIVYTGLNWWRSFHKRNVCTKLDIFVFFPVGCVSGMCPSGATCQSFDRLFATERSK